MEITQSYLFKFQQAETKPRNEREELLTKFLNRLNLSRADANLKPLTYGRLVKLFEGVPTADLFPFFRKCDAARNFSKMFWWSVKPK